MEAFEMVFEGLIEVVAVLRVGESGAAKTEWNYLDCAVRSTGLEDSVDVPSVVNGQDAMGCFEKGGLFHIGGIWGHTDGY